MDHRTFKNFVNLIYEQSGIKLGEKKEALVCARVAKRMRALGIEDHRAYFKHIEQDETGEEIVQLLDAISTNVTHFFRERDHFEFLSEIVKDWLKSDQRRFRIWSAASSSGEEAYSIAMTVLEAANGSRPDVRILATDISTRVLEKAREGVYEGEKLAPVPRPLKARYFEKIRGTRRHGASSSGPDQYRVKPVLKSMAVFKRLNLSQPPFPMRGPLDVVFCRNVMIYFDNETRCKLLAEIHRLVKPGGYLMVGHAESLAGMLSDFKNVKPSICVKEG